MKLLYNPSTKSNNLLSPHPQIRPKTPYKSHSYTYPPPMPLLYPKFKPKPKPLPIDLNKIGRKNIYKNYNGEKKFIENNILKKEKFLKMKFKRLIK